VGFTKPALPDIFGFPPEIRNLIVAYVFGQTYGGASFGSLSFFPGMSRMKSKMHYHVQPREAFQPRNEQARLEIQNFLHALDSYPARAAKEPLISFQQHLSTVSVPTHDDRRSNRVARRRAAKRPV
jgi:hypothetical protein